MALETGTVINDLVITNPTAIDAKSEGDDHIRLLKKTIKNSFPGFAGAVIAGGISTGITNAYLLAAPIQSYTINTVVVFTPNIANTGNSTININGLGIVGIKHTDGTILTANDLIAGQYIEMIYNGTEFRLLNVTKNYVDNLSFSASLPDQTGNSGKIISTDGAVSSWTNALSLLSLSLTNALPIASGGTNAATAPLARTSLGAAASGANNDITSLTGLTTPLAVAYGGIGSTTSGGAPFALKGANNDITSLTGLTTPLSVSQGGTGNSSGVFPDGTSTGTIIAFSGSTVPTGYLVCPHASTNISRTTYAALFAVIGVAWGNGDEFTTFGMPFFAIDQVPVQYGTGASVGSNTPGSVIAHTHNQNAVVQLNGPGPVIASGTGYQLNGTAATGSTGGAANLAAGNRVKFCVKY